MQHLLKPNLALIATRQVTRLPFNHVFVSRWPIEEKTGSHDRTTQVFPLYVYAETGQFDFNVRQSALSPEFAAKINRLMEEKEENTELDQATPEHIFSYIYSILHSPQYRDNFGPQLMGDFPHIPVTERQTLFYDLAQLGDELVALHLMEFALEDEANAPTDWLRYPSLAQFDGNNQVIEKFSGPKTAWRKGRVAINRSSGFTGVPEEVWDFYIGGYQVCHKWLKDRKGRTLSDADILHYCKIITALHQTIRLMAEIDEVIEAYGGWPIE
jgi:predicted helicase